MRLSGRGLIDRERTVTFTFDGRRVEAHPGDTVASALLAAGIRLVGRSFKYHRPRGIVTAGSEEPTALVTVGRGATQRPNTRATVQEVYDGLEVRSQNRWPMLAFDALAVNDLAAPFLPAGFYYKTFMWPRAAWERLYEPLIRRAAGLGRLSGAPAPDRDERAFAHCDLLVIGAGPAGLMAALTAGRAGVDVILAYEDPAPGGRLLCEAEEIGDGPAAAWARQVADELAAMPTVRLMPRTTVTGAYDHGQFGALERVAEHLADPGDAPPRAFWRIRAARAILATGAIERGIAFPGNDRPGVMRAGAVRAYLHRWGVAAGARVAVFGAGSDVMRTVRDLVGAGVEVAALIDAREGGDIAGLPAGLPVWRGAEVVGTSGRLGLASVTIRHAEGTHRIACDTLAVAGGWDPAVHLACHHGARPIWREEIAAFVAPEGAVPGLIPAGAAAGVFNTAGCLADGARAAGEALDALGRKAPAADLPEAPGETPEITPLWAVDAPGRAFLDLQNDVTVKDVRLAAQENFRSVEHMKRYTTQGMATDQGKGSNVPALAILAAATGRDIPGTGTTTYRPPFVPVPIASMGAGAGGQGFAPRRLTTSDRAARARGAPMVEAGQWYRASYFPAPGETTWREACDREVRTARGTVGVCDVSTLGRIEVQGPDAPAFLDFVYANRMASLKPGRMRYGAMLREDGHVMDDGVLACLAPGRYVLTTTTAAAGQVMQHMEFARQVLRPDLDVACVSATEHWAQIAIAGPRAKELLAAVADVDLPFMGCAEAEVAGLPGRVFRVSFSGEAGFEIAVPARHGEALWRVLLAGAETLGGGPYGLEALNVLRIEKGFLTHAELHGRTTLYDLGMGGMLKDADCIGRAAATRPGLVDPDRARLVGLRPVEAAGTITPGAHLFGPEGPVAPETDRGYVTSAGYSPTLATTLALGFLARGPERHGERVRAVDRLRGLETLCEVCPPCFFDPEGERARG